MTVLVSKIVPFGFNMDPKCSKMVPQSRLRLSLGDFGGKMPSPKRPWDAKGLPKGSQKDAKGRIWESVWDQKAVKIVNLSKLSMLSKSSSRLHESSILEIRGDPNITKM